MDFVSTVPFDRIFANVGRSTKLIRIVRLVRLMKLTRLAHIARMFNSLREWGVSARVLRLAKLLLSLTFMSHLASCVFFYCYSEQELGEACGSGVLLCKGAEGMLTSEVRRVGAGCCCARARRGC